LCAALSDTDSYTGKTAHVRDFFTNGTDGSEYRNPLRLYCIVSVIAVPSATSYLCSTLDPETSCLESESESLYNWQFTANQFILTTSPLRHKTSNLFFNWTLAVIVLTLFTIAAEPRQRSHSEIRVPRNSSHFAVSDSRLLQPGAPGPRIYIPRNRVARLHPQAPGSLSVAYYDSQGYGGGIRPHLHAGIPTTLSWAKLYSFFVL
jgi:hypothetical protein